MQQQPVATGVNQDFTIDCGLHGTPSGQLVNLERHTLTLELHCRGWSSCFWICAQAGQPSANRQLTPKALAGIAQTVHAVNGSQVQQANEQWLVLSSVAGLIVPECSQCLMEPHKDR